MATDTRLSPARVGALFVLAFLPAHPKKADPL